MIGYLNDRKYQRTSIVATQMDKKIVAPLQYEGTMDHVLFEVWFEQCLIPSLPENPIIVMDNASFHRKVVLKLLAEKHGQILIFLPPYSPNLNPIENFWAWLKGKLRKILSRIQMKPLRGYFAISFGKISITLLTKIFTPIKAQGQRA